MGATSGGSGGISVTFSQLWHQMQMLASGLRRLGLRPGERVGLFSENSSRWLVADQVRPDLDPWLDPDSGCAS